MDTNFDLYEDENTIINLDQSQVLNIVSSWEMDHVWDSIHNQIIQYKQIN
jgi:hypothetical protein